MIRVRMSEEQARLTARALKFYRDALNGHFRSLADAIVFAEWEQRKYSDEYKARYEDMIFRRDLCTTRMEDAYKTMAAGIDPMSLVPEGNALFDMTEAFRLFFTGQRRPDFFAGREPPPEISRETEE